MTSRPEVSRRAFVGAAIGTATMTAVSVPSEVAEAYNPGDDELRARYRADSPDVQAFYRTNRYES
jgi:hypothetical protein